MQTHLDLICEQLDTLVTLLQRESRMLHDWAGTHLKDWSRDDYDTLTHDVEQLTTEFTALTNGDLSTRLYDIREFASVLLHNQNLAPVQHNRLQFIYLTSADLLDIVEEIAIR